MQDRKRSKHFFDYVTLPLNELEVLVKMRNERSKDKERIPPSIILLDFLKY